MGSEGIKINVENFLIDDVHACIDKIEDQFTLKIQRDKNNKAYSSLLAIFENALRDQSEVKFLNIDKKMQNEIMQGSFLDNERETCRGLRNIIRRN